MLFINGVLFMLKLFCNLYVLASYSDFIVEPTLRLTHLLNGKPLEAITLL